MIIGFQILGTAVTIFRPFELKIPIFILYHAALGRKAEAYYRQQGIPLFFFQQVHCFRQPVRCNKRSGGIDTTQGIKMFPTFFILRQHFFQHILRSGIIICRLLTAHERNFCSIFSRHFCDLFIIGGYHDPVKYSRSQCCFDGIRQDRLSTEFLDIFMRDPFTPSPCGYDRHCFTGCLHYKLPLFFQIHCFIR